MSKPRTSMLVGLLAALVLVCLATFTLYARQQKPAQPRSPRMRSANACPKEPPKELRSSTALAAI